MLVGFVWFFFYYYYFFPLFFFFLNRVYNIIICLIQLRTKHHHVAYIHNVKFQYIVKIYQLTFKITLICFTLNLSMCLVTMDLYLGYLWMIMVHMSYTKYRNILRKVSRKEMVVLDISWVNLIEGCRLLARERKFCNSSSLWVHFISTSSIAFLSILKCVTLYQVTIIPSYLYSEMREFKIFNTSHFVTWLFSEW